MSRKSVFRWQDQPPNGAFAYSGRAIIGHVVQRSTDQRWIWKINDVVGSKHQRATQGTSKTEATARAAFRKAWLYWLSERGLREVE